MVLASSKRLSTKTMAVSRYSGRSSNCTTVEAREQLHLNLRNTGSDHNSCLFTVCSHVAFCSCNISTRTYQLCPLTCAPDHRPEVKLVQVCIKQT